MKPTEAKPIHFEIDETLEIKGLSFKIVLIDAGAKKICLKQISEEEVSLLNEELKNK